MKTAGTGFLAALLLWSHPAWGHTRATALITSTVPGQLVLRYKYEGYRGCGQKGCHNDQQAAALVMRSDRWARGGETALWLKNDRHADAYNVLLNRESRQMARNLGLKVPPEKADLCLNCHALNPPERQRGSKYSLTAGVSCESCHGPAQHWLAIHTRSAWKALPPSQKSRYGFRDLTSITNRVRTCAHCHVGDAERNVNHDLLAAGHPPLEFEAASFHDRQIKHWDFPREQARDPLIQPRLWLAGQVESARALATVVSTEAERGLWPEFAYYNCSSCHHRLTGAAASVAGQGQAGQVQWGRWQEVFADVAARRFERLPASAVLSPLKQTQQAMQPGGTQRAVASREAKTLAEGLGEWSQALSGHRLTAADADSLLRTILHDADAADPALQRERFLAVRALTDIPGSQLQSAVLDELIAEFDKPPINPRPLNPATLDAALDGLRRRLAP